MNLQAKKLRTTNIQTANSQNQNLQDERFQTQSFQTQSFQSQSGQNSRVQAPALLLELEDELSLRIGHAKSVLNVLTKVQIWADTDPFLINLLSRQLAQCLPLAVRGEEAHLVDELVQRKILEDWRQNTAAMHLHQIESTLLSYPQKDSLLILYLKVLQRGEAEADDRPEQAALLSSGLIVLKNETLRVANAIYANVFDLNWLEQQIPGITKPVTIVRSGVLPIEGSRRLAIAPPPALASRTAETSHDRPASTTRLYSKAMVLFCLMAVVATILTTYFKKTETPAIANSAAGLTASANIDSSAPNLLLNPTTENQITDKQRFDSGMEQATNSRWLPMMREFCSIPKDSAYFEPAKRNMEKWAELYAEDIEIAKAVATDESAQPCAVMP